MPKYKSPTKGFDMGQSLPVSRGKGYQPPGAMHQKSEQYRPVKIKYKRDPGHFSVNDPGLVEK